MTTEQFDDLSCGPVSDSMNKLSPVHSSFEERHKSDPYLFCVRIVQIDIAERASARNFTNV